MSHASRAAMASMKDVSTLEKAATRCGWKTARNATVRSYYNSAKKFELVLKNPRTDGYDIGVIKNKDGTLTFEGDLSMLRYDDAFQKLGENYGLLKQAYTVEEDLLNLRSQGFPVVESVLANGVIQLEAEIETIL